MGESDSQDTISQATKAEVAVFHRTVRIVRGNHTARIGKCELRISERNPVLVLIFQVFPGIPVKPHPVHFWKPSMNMAI